MADRAAYSRSSGIPTTCLPIIAVSQPVRAWFAAEQHVLVIAYFAGVANNDVQLKPLVVQHMEGWNVDGL